MYLTFALKCPLSQARATLYRYCRLELSLVYMSAILPCISYTQINKKKNTNISCHFSENCSFNIHAAD